MEWEIVSGRDLKVQLDDWANKAGWQLVWEVEYDYTIRNGAIFSGEFVEVVTHLFESLRDVSPKLYPTLYKGNKVLLVRGQQ
ncbi:hypothetical protein BUE93_09260 [Chromobacterium amazonense]|uniref:Toxin co-regulated pilus biosynthesis protein Q C-terminal domain-containing protein n=2 Tax=Chromobacterium amazonense TaxID=1382803 RepID=A0A2S9X5E7_9NEIS|nr:hypothetical protein BUE93_09260 [Chromobacterium amazonense]